MERRKGSPRGSSPFRGDSFRIRRVLLDIVKRVALFSPRRAIYYTTSTVTATQMNEIGNKRIVS